MSDNFLLNNYIDVVEAAASAGTADTLTSDVVDTLGYDGVTFLCLTGDATATAVLVLTAQRCDSDGGNPADLDLTTTFTAGASDADNKILALECIKPQNRYMRCTLDRSVANCVISGIVAVLHSPADAPCTQADVIASDAALSPGAA